MIQTKNSGRAYLSPTRLAVHIDVSRAQVYRLMRNGKLPDPVQVGKQPRWPVDVIDDWVQSGQAAA
jgi:predicted DNA-binding transcriptional regulator AlpA